MAKYDVGMAVLGNGITVYNRAVTRNGDFKNIAHISENGVVRYYDKKIPSDIKKKIELEAKKTKRKSTAFKRKGRLKKLYEVYFNNRKNNFDRVYATSKKEAEEKIKKLYPKDKVTGIKLIS